MICGAASTPGGEADVTDLGDASPGAEADDEGWEDEDTAAAAEAGEDPAEGGDDAPATTPALPPAPAKIPPQFILDGAGLVARGDVCRR